MVLTIGDILTEDWSDATILFAMTLCFPDEMLAAVERKALDLQVGARIVTMHYTSPDKGGSFLLVSPIAAKVHIRSLRALGERSGCDLRVRPAAAAQVAASLVNVS